VSGFSGVIEHDIPRTRGRKGQALREIRLPDCPQQPVVLGFRLAGHAGDLGG
jgi:hypothetical protein